MDFIPFDQLVVGNVYSIKSRNLNLGVFTGKGFIGIRTKFGSQYLSEEYEYSTCSSFGTARAIKCIGKISGIPLVEVGATVCYHCRKEAVFDRPMDLGGRGWIHAADETPLCPPVRAGSLPNTALFEALEEYEKTFQAENPDQV